MSSALLLATILTQFVPAATDQEIGALNALYTTALAVQAGTRTITRNAAKTRVCVKFAGGAAAPTGSVTVRAGVVVFSVAVQQKLGMALPPGATSWLDATEQYGVLEVQAVPTSTSTFDLRLLTNNFDWLKTEVELRATPVDATCEVALARADDATFGLMARCACAATPATCTWNRSNIDGSTTAITPAPIGVTFTPGSFTGAGCFAKNCAVRFDGVGIDKTWPAVCPR